MGSTAQYFSYGNAIISGYYPDAVFASNYLAGASRARYPSGTLVGSPFEHQFVNVTAGDYTVRAGSVLKSAAPDGSDVGANFPELMAAIEGVQAGVGPLTPEADRRRLPPAVDFSSACDVPGVHVHRRLDRRHGAAGRGRVELWRLGTVERQPRHACFAAAGSRHLLRHADG